MAGNDSGAAPGGPGQPGYSGLTSPDQNLLGEYQQQGGRGVNLLAEGYYQIPGGGYVSAKTNNPISNEIVSEYNAYLAHKQTSSQQHSEYLNIVNQTPGRSATILTDRSQGNTIIGSTNAQQKTLLGY